MGTKMKIKPSTSLFLDFVRFIAALIVFSYHCFDFWIPEAASFLNPIAHGAVIAFFVLSGYVVAYSTLNNPRGARHYIIARLSRLYSVTIPALFLTWLLVAIGSHLNPAYYNGLSRGAELARIALCAFFVQNIWFCSACPPTNGPLWSISYEFWYYAIFGAAVFIRSPRIKALTLLAFALISGPNILLLLPCWLLGVAAYRYRSLVALSQSTACSLFLALLVVLALIVAWMPKYPGLFGTSPFWFSGAFLSDWITASVQALAIMVFDSITPPAFVHRLSGGIRFCSDRTFSLYLYHCPFIVFAVATLPMKTFGLLSKGAVMMGILAIIFPLSYFTESKRNAWRIALEHCWDWIANRAALRAASAAQASQSTP